MSDRSERGGSGANEGWEPVESSVGSRRQRIVVRVREVGRPMTVDELVDALEDGTSAGSWEELHRQLHEYDLPALDHAGVVQFDADGGLVADVDVDLSERKVSTVADRPSPGHDGVEAEGTGRTGDGSAPWATYYAALAAAGVVVLSLVAVGAGPLAAVPALLVTGGVVAAFALLSVVHFLTGRVHAGRGPYPD